MSGERLGKYELKCEDVPREVNGICEDNEGTIWATQLKGGYSDTMLKMINLFNILGLLKHLLHG